MQSIRYYFSHRFLFICGLIRVFLGETNILPDKIYLKILFRALTGYSLNLKNPKTFNEKIQWLKLYNRNPIHTPMVDKIEVKKIVSSVIGDKYVIPLVGDKIWNKFDDIDFSTLPKKFVLKTSHSGGNTGVVIVQDKNKMDKDRIKSRIEKSMRKRVYPGFKEWPYKNIVPRIFAEELIEAEDGDLKDFKFLCFNGEPKYLYVASNRQSGEVCFDYYDMNFNHLNVKNGHPNSKELIDKPSNWDEMIRIARELSKSEPFVRIDLYNVKGRIYFGEYTFFSNSGILPFDPYEWDEKFGECIILPNMKNVSGQSLDHSVK